MDELIQRGAVLVKTKGLDGEITRNRVDLMAEIILMTWLHQRREK